MITKRILVSGRLRRPPATGWSWIDGHFVREHMDHLSREAVLLYFFLSAVADVNGCPACSKPATSCWPTT
jgi:hypothetical protein